MHPNTAKIREGIIACICFGDNKNVSVSQYDIVKTFFLADRSHLNKYGRPISFDNYVAMKHGPVPSLVYDVLKEDADALMRIGIDKSLWKRQEAPELGYGCFAYSGAKRKPDANILSPSDIELLKASFSTVKSLGFKQIRKLTHEDAAYIDAWEDDSTRKQFPMSYALMFDSVNDEMAQHISDASAFMQVFDQMFKVGDIVKFKSGTAGKPKYHLCLFVGTEEMDAPVHRFLFISSGGEEFADSFAFDTNRFPMPPSDTGLSVVSLSMIPRVRVDQMHLYPLKVEGRFPSDVAKELLELIKSVRSLSAKELAEVRAVLTALC